MKPPKRRHSTPTDNTELDEYGYTGNISVESEEMDESERLLHIPGGVVARELA